MTRDVQAIRRAQEENKSLRNDMVVAMRALTERGREIDRLLWSAYGFKGEPTRPAGFAFFCLNCGGWASLGTTWDAEGYAGTSFTCSDCGERETY